MICLHGHDHPDHCSQCPKEPQKTRARLNALLAMVSPDARPTLQAALDAHDKAFQEANLAELQSLRDLLRTNTALLSEARAEARQIDGRAVMAKLKEIEMKIDEGFGGG